jgi:hypothetical protein
MNLAEQCQAIWPINWTSDWNARTTVSAIALGHDVVVQEVLGGSFNAYLQDVCTVSATLRGALELLHNQLKALPPIPDLVEVPVHQQAEEILEAQGWVLNVQGTYVQGDFTVRQRSANDPWALWTRDTDSTKPIKSVFLEQGKVREQLKELLTFPQWKDTP